MYTILQTQCFDEWLSNLRDAKAVIRIGRRIQMAQSGNFGDHKHIAGSIWEMRLHYGPGYRLYYARKDEIVYILLCGGDKSSQQQDINLAIELLEAINEE